MSKKEINVALRDTGIELSDDHIEMVYTGDNGINYYNVFVISFLWYEKVFKKKHVMTNVVLEKDIQSAIDLFMKQHLGDECFRGIINVQLLESCSSVIKPFYPPNNPNAAELLPSEQVGLPEPEKSIKNETPQAKP